MKKKSTHKFPKVKTMIPKLFSTSRAIVLASMGILLFYTTSCNKQEDEAPNLDEASFEQVISAAGIPEKVARVEEELAVEEKEELREDGSLWLCSVKTYSVEDGNSNFPLFNPNASVIYPGSLLQGKTLKNASPSVIPVKRGAGRISIDIIDGSNQPYFSVDEVTKSNIANAANQIIGSSSGKIPANFHFTYDEIKSEEHLAFGLGLDVQSQFVEISARFNFTKDEKYNHFLVKLNQSFYTLSYDIPTSYSDLFAPEVTPADLAKYVGTGNPVTYISDVTYGRIYYMLIESTSSSLDIQSKLEASFSGGVTSAELALSADYLKSLSNLKIKIVAFGGESGTSFETIGETNISKLATLFGESSDIKTGVPISYVVRDAVKNEVVNVKLATEYDVKECKPIASALGNPMIHYDAETLLPSSQFFDHGSLAYDGKYRYYEPHDSFAREYAGQHNGVVVVKWKDISGNELHASAVSNDPDSRPMLVERGFNNGKPAVEFFRGDLFGEGTFNRLTFSGGTFTNTDYTLFLVVAVRDRVKLEWRDQNRIWGIRVNEPNNQGYFIQGTRGEMYHQLLTGFQNNGFRFSHLSYGLYLNDGTIVPNPNFQVIALRFSQTEGMSVYANGQLVGKDPTKKKPLITFEGAMICAGSFGTKTGFSRMRLGELRAYKTAATEQQIIQETKILNEKFGL